MKELICQHKDGHKIRTVIESAIISESITDLRKKGYRSFVIKSVANVNTKDFDWKGGFEWLSAN